MLPTGIRNSALGVFIVLIKTAIKRLTISHTLFITKNPSPTVRNTKIEWHTVYVRRHVDLSETNVRTWTRNFAIREVIFSLYGPYDPYWSTNFSKLHLVITCFADWKAVFTIRKSFSRTVRFIRSVKPFSVGTVRTIRTDRRIFLSFT